MCRVAPLLMILLAAGCSKTPDECDVALGKVVASLEQRLEEPGSPSRTEVLKRVMEGTKKHFPPVCRELDEAGKACLARMDEFLAAGRRSDADSRACADKVREEGLELKDEEACFAAADARYAEALGECKETMGKLEAEVDARAQADWEAKQK